MTLSFAPERIETWPLERLKPYARNAKTHGADQVAKIAGSMAQFGWTVPVLVSGDGEVIAGHGRILAATQLGLTEAPVIVLDHLTEEQRKAYRLADNKLTELGAWDEALLAGELQELAGGGLRPVGRRLLRRRARPAARLRRRRGRRRRDDGEDDPRGSGGPGQPAGRSLAARAAPAALRRRHGHHRPRPADGGAKADLCFTDSPYNVDYAGGVGAEKAGKGRRILNDALGDGFERFLYDACVSIIAHTAGAIYMCMSSSELHTLQKAFVAAGGHWSTFIIWAKDRFTLGRSDYQRQFEPILYGWPEGAKHHWCGARDQGDVWFIDRPSRNDLHPTMKPVGLVERAIRNSSPRGGLVLDPFGGSGTTLIAAERTGRTARLIELDPRYCDVIVERWQGETGRSAVLETTGETFHALATEKREEARVEDGAV